MNWYFNNEGMADGPYDEPTMTDLAGGGRVGAETLVWQPTMSAWQEAAAVNAPWWRPPARTQPIVVNAPTTRSLNAPLPSDVRRTPVPNAPTDVLPSQTSSSGGGFFKKLFGGGRKK